VCIICREEMHLMCKKLPCNHIFHTSCLRSWFQRQQTCPTCRMDVLRLPTASASPNLPQGHQPRPAVGELPQPAFHAAYPLWPPNYMAAQQPQFANNASSQSSITGIQQSNTSNVGNFVIPQQLRYPLLPPLMVPNLAELSEDDLRRMHVNEGQHIEARMQCLRNIQTLLNAAVLHLHQYMSIVESAAETQNRQTGDSDTIHETPATVPFIAANIERSSAIGDSVTSCSETAADDVDDGIEGAVGYTKETTPNSMETNYQNAGTSEVRKRRIQHFSASPD